MVFDKKIPVLFTRKEECCGCAACYSICPKKAITMELDNEGFLYPMVNADACIRCYKCMNVCPIKAAIKFCGDIERSSG